MVMTLQELLAPWPDLTVDGDPSVTVGAVVEDSRAVVPGDVFVAVVGHGVDGHRFVPAAVAAGAGVVVVDRERRDEVRAALPENETLVWVVASHTRGLSARLAREREGRPDQNLQLVGVTGTNGKTTASFLLQEMLRVLHGPCGLLGTIHYDDGRCTEPAPLTTPGGPVLYRWLARMRDVGCRSAAMEVSSHALDQQRPGDLALDAALLTNLGRDHLDYHGDMATYLAAKRRIFDLLAGPDRGKGLGVAVVNVGDPEFAAVSNPHGATVRYSPRTDSVAADLTVQKAELSLEGTRLTLDWRGHAVDLASPLVGRFNVENLTAALAVGLALGYAPSDCVTALGGVRQVPGRVERFLLPAGALAVVDYAHTHDALAAVLETCRELSDGELFAVFGCGGDRDRGKRPLMGQVAAGLADRIWITSDNPRSEDPDAICRDIVAGYDQTTSPRAGECTVIADRTEAIRAALAAARSGDVVVIAGKGHEDYQLVGEEVRHLDDREIVTTWVTEQDHEA